MQAAPNPISEIDQALAETERAGLLLTLNVRTALVVLIMVFIGSTQGLVVGYFGVAVCSVFLVSGLIYRWLVVRNQDRDWMRFGFVALDAGMLAVVATVVPLSLHGDVPQIFVFRVYGVKIFFFLVATSALSLSPGLVLWTGVASVGAIWGAWGWIVSQMEVWVRWSAITDERTAEKYIEIVLDPNHIQLADRFLDSIVIIATALVIAAAVQRARRMLRSQIASERERAEVSEVFGRFVPEEVVETLSASSGSLPPVAREATVLFVDVQGFTRFAEHASPARIVAVLDAFFDEVSTVVSAHRGVMISLIGDAAMVSFNAPLENADHAASSIEAARELVQRVAQRDFEGERLGIRIGIATGEVAAGTVGGKGRRSYTLYGDTVNLAQRLEAHNKELGTHLLVDQSTWEAASQPEILTDAGPCPVRGRDAGTVIYRLVDSAQE